MSQASEPRRIGGYEVVEELGRGGFGEVVLARSPGGSLCVVKTSLMAAGGNSRQRFVEEARTLTLLSHPNISRLVDVGYAEDRLFIVLEFVPGIEVSQMLVRHGAVPPAVAVHIAKGVLHALDYAHTQLSPATQRPLGLVHRDVSTKNVLVTFTGDVKLIDFGIATSSEHPRLTVARGVLGTLGYIAPERLIDDFVDARADVYAAGVVLYELLVGRRFFAGKDRHEILRLLEARHFEPPLGDVPDALRPIVLAATHGQLAQRTPTAAAMLAALDRLPSAFSTPDPRQALARLLVETLPDEFARMTERQQNEERADTVVHARLGMLVSVDDSADTSERQRRGTQTAGASAPEANRTSLTELPAPEPTRISLRGITATENGVTTGSDTGSESVGASIDADREPTFVGGQSGLVSSLGAGMGRLSEFDADFIDDDLSITDPPLALPPEISRVGPLAPPPPPPVLSAAPRPPAVPGGFIPSPFGFSADDAPAREPPHAPFEWGAEPAPSPPTSPLTSMTALTPSLRGRLVAASVGGTFALLVVVAVFSFVSGEPAADAGLVVDVEVDAGEAIAVVVDAVDVAADAGGTAGTAGTAGGDAGDVADEDEDAGDEVDVDVDAGVAAVVDKTVVDAGATKKEPKKNPPKKKRRPPPAPMDGTVGDLVAYLRIWCTSRVSCARPLVAREKNLSSSPAELQQFAAKAAACAARCER